jgi:hypothetical protein
MLGFLIAGIIAVINYFHHLTLDVIFLKSTHFLFHWYIITTTIMGVIMVLITLLGIGVASAKGGILGFFAGSAASVIGWVIFAFRRALFLIGAYLLSTAVTYGSIGPDWDTAKLAVGGLLLLIALMTRGKGSHSVPTSSD